MLIILMLKEYKYFTTKSWTARTRLHTSSWAHPCMTTYVDFVCKTTEYWQRWETRLRSESSSKWHPHVKWKVIHGSRPSPTESSKLQITNTSHVVKVKRIFYQVAGQGCRLGLRQSHSRRFFDPTSIYTFTRPFQFTVKPWTEMSKFLLVSTT